jgi:hypothetical protein
MKALKISSILSLVFVAIILLAHYRQFGLHLDLEIKPLDLAILMVNLFIALYLSQYLLDKAGNLRAEKDLLIADLRNILSDLKLSREALIACQDAGKITKADKTLILSILRRVANGTNLTESALKLSQCTSLCEKACDEITRAYIQYKTSATGGNFPTAFNPDQISDQERDYFKLVEKLHALLFKINQHS